MPTTMSGFVYVDLDGLDDPEEMKARLSQEAFVWAVWRSCSGRGLAVLGRFSGLSPERYEAAWQILANRIALALGMDSTALNAKGKPIFDPSVKHATRICFVTYDPNIWINEGGEVLSIAITNAELWGELGEGSHSKDSGTKNTSTTTHTTHNAATCSRLATAIRDQQAREARAAAEIQKLPEKLREFYVRDVLPLYPPVPGDRNQATLRAAGKLIRFYGLRVVRQLLIAYYNINNADGRLWEATPEEHAEEVDAAIKACLNHYIDAMPVEDREAYTELSTDLRRDCFRILRGLAFVAKEGVFPLSQGHLADRLGCAPFAAQACLTFFMSIEALEQIDRGAKRVAGQNGISATWTWHASTELAALADSRAVVES